MPQIHQNEISHPEPDIIELPPADTTNLSRAYQIQQEAARIISAVVHPILYPLFVVAVVGYVRSRNIAYTTLLVCLAVVLTAVPVAVLVWMQVKRGAWSDFDVSRRKQRYTLYPYTLAWLAFLAFIYYTQLHATYAFWLVVALVIANIVNSCINLIWKISAHATTAASCATSLWLLVPAWGPLAALSVISVGWSRVVLGRHTTGQVLAGAFVGSTSAYFALHILGRLP